VHFVDTDYDTGPILAQVKVTVSPTDDAQTLEKRVKDAEKELLVTTLRELAAQYAQT
jgi:folate-dependent phosphoribosylglycinamide formyltransferase PurN